MASKQAGRVGRPPEADLLGKAVEAHRGGQFALAERLSAEAIRARPGFAEAHYHLANAQQQQGKLREAAESYRRALAIEPRAAEARFHLGLTLAALGQFDDAIAAYRAVLAAHPKAVPVHVNLAWALERRQRLDEAIDCYRQALAIEPKAAPVHVDLGMALERQGRLDDAVASYRRAIELDPTLVAGFNNLGSILRDRGRLAEALDAYREAARLDPGAAPIQVNLGVALAESGRPDEALACLERAIALDPNFAEAHKSRALIHLERGDLGTAFAAFRRHAELKYGPSLAVPATTVFPHRGKHDLEQLAYLRGIAGDDPALGRLRPPPAGEPAPTDLFRGYLRLEDGARVAGPAINPGNLPQAVEARWAESRPKLVVIDDLLTPDALEGMRRFCWGSTMWRRGYREGYLGAIPESGFAAPLLAQISDELRLRFPGVFHQHLLTQCWAFKYDSTLTGINIHADFAAVNVNFWITPDDANLDPEHGGLVVWDVPAPLDWDFEKYNADPQAMRDFLAAHHGTSVTVPYRANRAVIFDSDLFHETDRIAFREGYQNRRINVTLLYGRREDDGGNADGS
ncbi:MAG TPA: tetratricopeptide repeat protein [Stellaceae bacterium]|nr:tetratricopeptide repeat protein [Stellaceae bacterium]